MKALPPFDFAAPVMKSSCPPVPEMCRVPELSEDTWPYRSTLMQLLMATMLSMAPMSSGEFTYSRGHTDRPGL